MKSTLHSVRSHLAAVTALAFAATIAAGSTVSAQETPTAADYVKIVGGEARLVAAGQLVLDGRKISCGQTPTVLYDMLDDYGAAYHGFIILNPRLMQKISTAVKLWSYAHECGHQIVGANEDAADCFAVQWGRQQGWLSSQGLEEVCSFIAKARASSVHRAGPERCKSMRVCFAVRSVPTLQHPRLHMSRARIKLPAYSRLLLSPVRSTRHPSPREIARGDLP